MSFMIKERYTEPKTFAVVEIGKGEIASSFSKENAEKIVVALNVMESNLTRGAR